MKAKAAASVTKTQVINKIKAINWKNNNLNCCFEGLLILSAGLFSQGGVWELEVGECKVFSVSREVRECLNWNDFGLKISHFGWSALWETNKSQIAVGR